MSKELEALEIIGKLYLINDEQVKDWDRRDFNILKSALKRLEAIDNAKPSGALNGLEQFINEMTRCLENPKEYVKGYEKQIFWKYKNTLETTIKQALLKAQKEHKALEIIKEKRVNVGTFIHLTKILKKDYEQCKALNNTFGANICETEKEFLTEEEFELLRSVLGC